MLCTAIFRGIAVMLYFHMQEENNDLQITLGNRNRN